jgi:beta-lactamase class A
MFCAALVIAPPAESKAAVEMAAARALARIPGKSAFLFTRMDDTGIEPLFGINADQRFAVGSGFKLFILGRLIDEVNAGRRQLSDTMPLQPALVGPPHSELAEWPAGLPVSLGTLALKMISVSDNTATDHLHFLLGREEIERQMQVMGHSDPALNRPLFNTREMTELRDKKQGLPGRAYRDLDEAGRRAWLAKQRQDLPDYERLDFDTAAYDLAEWYASPLDMAHALAWIHRNTAEHRPAHLLRQVLTVDKKLPHDPAVWPFVGFKGGSEEQLLAGNWLLRHRNGHWYTLHAFFNNPDGPLKPAEVVPVIEQILKAIEPVLEVPR